MKLQQFVDRIASQCPGIRRVGIVTDIREIAETETDTPYAGLMWALDSVGPNDGMGQYVTQERERVIHVLFIGKTPRGDDEPIEDARREVFAAFVGWQPEVDGMPIQITHAGGEAADISGGLMRWRDSYTFTDYLRYQP